MAFRRYGGEPYFETDVKISANKFIDAELGVDADIITVRLSFINAAMRCKGIMDQIKDMVQKCHQKFHPRF